jgi:hypothetical protein
MMTLAATFIDTRTENRDASDAIYLRANFRVLFNRLTANLMGQSSWRIYGNARTRDDYVRIDITRYF